MKWYHTCCKDSESGLSINKIATKATIDNSMTDLDFYLQIITLNTFFYQICYARSVHKRVSHICKTATLVCVLNDLWLDNSVYFTGNDSLNLLMQLVANMASTNLWKKTEILLKPWHMGTHLRVLSESCPMNTSTTGFRWFSKIFTFFVLWTKVASALEVLNYL